jgi:ubiquinone/menaquinone biosynthesis C-methylase UbiE
VSPEHPLTPEPGHDHLLLAEQRAYYRRRAPEYDEWWQRRGRYDQGDEAKREWDRQIETVAGALARFDAGGSVLELAGGTGWWTTSLAQRAGHLTVLDASAEALAINRARVGATPSVDFVVADIFDWRPPGHFDVVFFSFWLSHVPRARFAEFWRLVRQCLGPGGRVFVIDNRYDPTIPVQDPYLDSEAGDIQHRRLNDGSEHRVVKVFYEPDELTAALGAEGWRAEIDGTRWFVYGTAVPN